MAAALAGTPLFACSGDDAKEEFIEAADAVCRTADGEIETMDVPRGKKHVDEYVDDARQIVEDLVGGLRELQPPEGDEDVLVRMTEGLQRATGLLDRVAEAVAARDREALANLQDEMRRATDEITETGEAYGFEVCGAQLLEPNA